MTASAAQQPAPPITSNAPSESAKSAPPTSTAPQSLEAQRVATLLELNRILLQEAVKEQAAWNTQKAAPNPSPSQQNPPSSTTDGSTTAASNPPLTKQATDTTTPTPTEDTKASPSNTATAKPAAQQQNQQQQSQPQAPQNQTKLPHTKEYVECMRRLQANLAYLAFVADSKHKPGNTGPPFPAIMEAPNLPPPPKDKEQEKEAEKKKKKKAAAGGGGGEEEEDARESIKGLYAKLKELWPEYKGKQPAPSPGSGAAAAATTTTTAGAAAGMGGTASQVPVVTTSAA
ncbi:MAG: hypothetical protein L6R39_000802 [Caloplaca ligustica]|nr:MAG: hypothetical protein L6R39_000802 [Caloplaca ligustica]